MTFISLSRAAMAVASAALMAGAAQAQPAFIGEPISEGRGWTFAVPLEPYNGFNEEQFVGATVAFYVHIAATATGGAVPEGIVPLDRDIFTSEDFYLDRALWSDPRYFR